MELTSWLKLLVFAAMAAVAIWGVRIKKRKNRKMLDALSREFGATPASNFKGFTWLDFDYESIGTKVMLQTDNRYKRRFPMLTLVRRTPNNWSLRITRESDRTKWLKRLRLKREIEVSDPAFDREFMIETDKPETAVLRMREWKAKEAVRTLFADGFFEIAADDTGITANLYHPTIHHLEPEKVKRWLECLDELISA